MNFLKKLFGNDRSQRPEAQSKNKTKTVNLSPGTMVTKSGLYYCTICKQVGSSASLVRETLDNLSKDKGNDTNMLAFLEDQFGTPGKNFGGKITKETFNLGAKLGECPQHKSSTLWSIDE